jgi:hypothetical protein
MKFLRTCIGEDGRFIVGIHRPEFEVKNLRENKYISSLGRLDDGTLIDNRINFPDHDLYEPDADIIYEIANPFPFRGTTYINSQWADKKAGRPELIRIDPPCPCSLSENFREFAEKQGIDLKDYGSVLDMLPHQLVIALAQASTDPDELVLLAEKSCRILADPATGIPEGMGYTKDAAGNIIPEIFDHELFEVLVNNRYLPDSYKNVMVLRPGVQGSNEITGEYLDPGGQTHVFEYLRRNSYIPWGHFAANMANDAIRYSAKDLSFHDMKGIRHLYYQRAFVRTAAQLGIDSGVACRAFTEDQLEDLRLRILEGLEGRPGLEFNATLWGWNFGYGYAHSGHRLHASHQMIHQQNAMVPENVVSGSGAVIPSFACGDLVTDFIDEYEKQIGKSFFDNYLNAIGNNTRTDGRDCGESSLVVRQDEHTVLFVPKAQVCEWELGLMCRKQCANIIQADTGMRNSLDTCILTAVKILEALGASMVTGIEFSGRFDLKDNDQRLMYSFIPRLPHAPDTFSEAQLRWISGNYPEDFAHACRRVLTELSM